MKPGINYAYLAKKYLNADVIVHDRTYEGLEWRGPGEKPSQVIFEAFQKEEDRMDVIEERKTQMRLGLMEEKQKQMKIKAAEEAKPLEQKLEESWEAIKAQVIQIKLAAIDLRRQKEIRADLEDCWYELSRVQEKINEEAKSYLSETDWYVTRFQDTKIAVPEDVARKREEARKRIQHGDLVYKNYDIMRQKEMPSREEIRQAILSGGQAFNEMKKIIQDVNLKFKKPKITA